jgi:AraC-like DNA-binding protein
MASRTRLRRTLDHRILPDGCVDVVIDLAASSPGRVAVVAGPTARPFSVPLSGKVDYLGVCFRPGAFFRLFDIAASELTDRIVPLAELGSIFPASSVEAICSCSTSGDPIALLEGILSRRLAHERREDHRLPAALAVVFQTGGVIPIKDLARRVHTSPRNLSRLFDRFVGLAPKVFCRIVRFQRVVRTLKDHPGRKQLSLALGAGYYDQAHLIHEFQALAGQPPTRLVRPSTGGEMSDSYKTASRSRCILAM